MLTVGTGIFSLTPVAAAVVVWSHSAVLFLFSSQSLEAWLQSHHLPTIPLVPVSSSQAIVGAVIGIGLLKGGRGIKWRTVAGITSSWVSTPVIAALVCFVSLFFLQNVFQQQTFKPVEYSITKAAMEKIIETGIPREGLEEILWETYPNSREFAKAVSARVNLNKDNLLALFQIAELFEVGISTRNLDYLRSEGLVIRDETFAAMLDGRTFMHKWEIRETLAEIFEKFRYREGDDKWNTQLDERFDRFFSQLED